MKDENPSFPNSHTPKCNSTSKITPNSNEILVPIIIYMDGISLDAHRKLTFTPQNFILGILNTETRSKAEAWEKPYIFTLTTGLSLLNNPNNQNQFIH